MPKMITGLALSCINSKSGRQSAMRFTFVAILTTAAGVLTYTNTVQNTGNANDTYTISAPTAPSGFTVEV